MRLTNSDREQRGELAAGSTRIVHLTSADIPLMRDLNRMFGEVFAQPEVYTGTPPSDDYLRTTLGSDNFIALAAVQGGAVVGGLAAYVLVKFEQARSEIYIYDLAVVETHRRRGIATSLIEAVRAIGRDRGAHAIFVQADTAEEDLPAIALYSKLGRREEVLHFDIDVV